MLVLPRLRFSKPSHYRLWQSSVVRTLGIEPSRAGRTLPATDQSSRRTYGIRTHILLSERQVRYHYSNVPSSVSICCILVSIYGHISPILSSMFIPQRPRFCHFHLALLMRMFPFLSLGSPVRSV